MTAKEYLSQASDLKRDIDRKHRQIMELQTMAERTTGAYEALRVSGTTSHSKLEDAVVKIMSVGDELSMLMADYAGKYREISAVIDAVENATYRELLALRYLSFMTWEEIAVKMRYSWRNIHYMHSKALGEVCIVLHTKNLI